MIAVFKYQLITTFLDVVGHFRYDVDGVTWAGLGLTSDDVELAVFVSPLEVVFVEVVFNWSALLAQHAISWLRELEALQCSFYSFFSSQNVVYETRNILDLNIGQ